ncbi:MAG: translation elongation factor Ts [Bacteroidales bacterium]|jgi:elongation factor Ts|nr:translation elongation factor Ts [Bacteroidales bacterium]
MAKITAAEVSKLRKITGAGMMDCKKALVEAEGDFDKAQEIIRERGQAIANKRSDREATEGAVIAKTTDDHKFGVVVCLNCETDFVAKNDDFVGFAHKIADIALDKKAKNLDALKAVEVEGGTLEEMIVRQSGVTGEKVDLSFYENLEAPYVDAYIHMGNKIGTIVATNKTADSEVVRNVAMQVAAMNPIAVDESSVSQEVKDKEFEIGRQQALNEGKPEAIVDKIATGKVGKFMKENTLLNQAFVRDNKVTIKQYLQQQEKDLTVVEFRRWALAE